MSLGPQGGGRGEEGKSNPPFGIDQEQLIRDYRRIVTFTRSAQRPSSSRVTTLSSESQGQNDASGMRREQSRKTFRKHHEPLKSSRFPAQDSSKSAIPAFKTSSLPGPV